MAQRSEKDGQTTVAANGRLSKRRTIGRGLRAQFKRHGFHFNQPISYQNTWLSQFRRRLVVDNAVIGLIVTNVAVFLLRRVADFRFMVQNFMIQLDNFKSGRFHTTITSAFSHHEVGHCLKHDWAIFFWEEWAFCWFSLLLGHAFRALSSKIRRLFEHDPSKVPGLGASGAVNAIMLLDIFLAPTKTTYLEFIVPVPAILLGNSQISGSAHLGGAAIAAIALARLRKGRF